MMLLWIFSKRKMIEVDLVMVSDDFSFPSSGKV